MNNVHEIGGGQQVMQRIIDDYVNNRGAIAATVLITFEDGRQIKLHGGDPSRQLDFLQAVGL